MNDLDLETLEAVRDDLVRRLRQMEVRRRNRPIFLAMRSRSRFMMDEVTPRIMAPATGNVRMSVLSMEQSVEKIPDRTREADEHRAAVLAGARARTQSLERWLEALS